MSLLAGVNYDPVTMVSKSCGTLQAMSALDATNLHLSFMAPTSGNVMVRMQGNFYMPTWTPGILFGVLDGATVRARVAPRGQGGWYSGGNTTFNPMEAIFTVPGLNAGQTYAWDAAWAIKYANASSYLRYGGPADTVSGSAAGAFIFEVWTA